MHSPSLPVSASLEQRTAAIEAALDARGFKPADFIAEQAEMIEQQWLPENAPGCQGLER